jgi:hypothetical protein
MSNAKTNIMVIPQMQDSALAGAFAWWRLSGDVSGDALTQTWAAAGLDEKMLPDMPSPEKALRRAAMEMKGPRRMVRPLGKEITGWAIVDEHAKGEDIGWAVECRVMLNAVGQASVEPADHPCAAQVLADFQAQLTCLSQQDVSAWLCRMVAKVNAVALRDTGGVYFVPRENLALWRAMGAALEAASANVMFDAPALRSDDPAEMARLVKSILASVEAEATKDAKDLEVELAEETLNTRSLKIRAERAERVLAKVQSYEALLGTSMDVMRKRIEDLQASITVAIFASEDEVK